ncbi:hypothetical protein [Bradyrhizobium sp. LMTR 3]|uniref:hypothetical protein n=1 Tax=Bradyrhizobium sp. LMTR 3 TaxID=189873 RepID=UPI0008109637|nr:hypothetical protein [Bradyrhizobium sp. LMTR 3]OCK55440.1 hypothetical protein LMTR3_11550 [Bradyrhizobium sp. LMTR 3]
MKNNRPAFVPLDTDLDDERLESLAREKGVGTLQKPQKQGEQGPKTPSPVEALLPEPPASGATPRERMKPLNTELPDYVWTELKIRAAHRQTSVRHVIMTALIKDGITIAEADLVEDGRRLRGRVAPQ